MAKSIGLVATSFTPILDGLEKRKLIVRQADKADRRAVFVSLTAAGKQLQPVIHEIWTKVERKFGGKTVGIWQESKK